MEQILNISEYFGFLSEISFDSILSSAFEIDKHHHPFVMASTVTPVYDKTKIHSIDKPNMEQFTIDLNLGKITTNRDPKQRIYESFDIMWSENLNFMCKVEETPTYNPNFFDDFCANFFWCLRVFDTSSCEPHSAYGLTR